MHQSRRVYRKASVALMAVAALFLTVGSGAAAGAGDSSAYEVMRRAVEARATWGPAFPGFSADIAVNLDGTSHSGRVRVTPTGGVELSGVADAAAQRWARGWLAAIVSHRLPSQRSPRERYRGIRFAEEAQRDHPLGARLILDDGFNSAFRVDGRVIRQVNRDLPGGEVTRRVRINVLETTSTSEGKVLPRHFVIHYLDGNGRLESVESVSTRFVSVGGYPLPRWRRVTTAGPDGEMTTGVFELSSHRLLERSGQAGD